ncbi:hypothetical protein [Streptomyces sp. NPDC058291]
MWTIGGQESHDRVCRRLALRTGAAVLSVDHRDLGHDEEPFSVISELGR